MFKVDNINGHTISWHRTENGVEAEEHSNYYPRFYIEGEINDLKNARVWLSKRRNVVSTSFEYWRPTLSKDRQKVLRVDCLNEDGLKTVVNIFKKNFGRRKFKYYNKGFSPQFRFCLQNEVCPVPDHDLRKADLRLSRKNLSNQDLVNLHFNDQVFQGTESEILEKFIDMWREVDPDLVLVNRGQLLELLNKKLDENGFNFSLGRINKFQQLAGENTISSYGQTLHSSSRYNVPGRVIIDRSNSFMLGEATLDGLWDLVERSYRPLQELAWGSIGRLLTSIEIRRAYLEEDTLTPWKNWHGEKPKKASTLHKADRGGFIFNPEPSIHYDVYEADFASLFPNIMVKKNISPETVNCSCCSNELVPELNYTICQKQDGFIGKVLEPLITDRQEMKEVVDNIEDENRRKYVQGSIDAIKWILVSCFGYMGHSHASYGAIKCHQAIQAYDREIMLQAKERFEKEGYTIAHGIIDSMWVQKDSPKKDFEQVCQDISEDIGIELEPEYKFEWCAFVPRSSSSADIATLNRYFGKKQNGEFKTAGIEVEQSSTCPYVKEVQMDMIKALDKNMDATDVIKVLRDRIKALRRKDVDPEKLLVKTKASKSLEQYQVNNRTVAALKRYRKHGINMKPGQKVEYLVKNDQASDINRVKLSFEEKTDYDFRYYEKQLIKAAESILSPIGYNKNQIRRRVNKNHIQSLKHFT